MKKNAKLALHRIALLILDTADLAAPRGGAAAMSIGGQCTSNPLHPTGPNTQALSCVMVCNTDPIGNLSKHC